MINLKIENKRDVDIRNYVFCIIFLRKRTKQQPAKFWEEVSNVLEGKNLIHPSCFQCFNNTNKYLIQFHLCLYKMSTLTSLISYLYSGLTFSGLLSDEERGDGVCVREGGGKRAPSLKSVTHIPQKLYFAVIIYLKKIQKICKLCKKASISCLYQHLSSENSNFCNIEKYKIRPHFFQKFLNIFFHKFGSIFDDIKESGYSNFFLKQRYVKVNITKSAFLLMTSQTNFFKRLKLHCRYGDVNKTSISLAFLWEKLSWSQFYKNLTRKNDFLSGAYG